MGAVAKIAGAAACLLVLIGGSAALHDTLSKGRIAGAGLDVFPAEPPSPSEPVLSLDNVVLTPHLAGSSRETRVKQTRNAFDNVLRVDRGERPLWVVPELRDMAMRQ